MKNLVLGVNDAIYRACIATAGLAIVIMALIIPWGVFSRYALGQGLGWPEPVAILLMVLFTFIGAAASYRAGAHMAVQVLSDRLPDMAQPFLTLFVRLAMGAISLFMLIWGYKLCVATWNQYLSTLTWMRVGISYAPIPLGGFVTLLFVIEQLLYGDQHKRRVVDYENCEDSKESV
ncbi:MULTISPECIES: TRAP transporter small permease [Pseudomonas]|jgi:TRAP-type C4-dicarboxylate transport system permease small subunit|uniref:TRAP transporter small permease protein n=1 Tax=Ectopseudomonas oleovorans TaxID=301 RepID=A0A653B0W0_ECTOL|nr:MULTISPECIES: TRAP transporter small permease [Pseudomonas]TNF10751.1 MAG: TRAP transporter small permease [Pseudomonadales bacterium]CAE6945493.1 TRAP-type C4-dicarboxylate transport system, small permease component [Pseudomonas oleovorans]QFT23373.1 Tripartite ATP-independent periplasmic transporter, DctQ component [Pseudomonas sp. THAF187a]QFT43561.1 Tripartite ATP-independent periplasmic transporter, DctQ component [Pseudomonas sp. THAF42]QTS85270.1 TRAP transporter small permease [Pseu